jgi:catechol 2,3-dioxygenase-like lactoylglutathione lyase family enzyme
MSSTNYSHCIPFLPVSNLEETIEFYKNKLGFTDEWYWGDPPTDAGISRDGLSLFFVLNNEHLAKINNSSHRLELCIFVSNVEEIYREAQRNGVVIHKELGSTPWKIREFSILDNNGYVLRIGEYIENDIEATHAKS